MTKYLISLLVILGVGGAHAQGEVSLGSHILHPAPAEIPIYGGLSSQDKARVTILAFSICVVATSRHKVVQALSLPPTADTTKRLFTSLATSNCLRYGTLQMPYSLMRGGMFAALYRADFLKTIPGIGMTELDISRIVGIPLDNKVSDYIALMTFADCVVRAAPDTARALLLAPIGSENESKAFSALAPKLNQCLAKGQTIAFSKSVLSAYLAEAAYREAMQSAAASPQVKVN